jgi:prephenate dehydratase
MRIFELLLEYDVSQVNSLASKLRSRTKDPSAPPAQTPVDLATVLENMGITNGATLFWILHRYLTATGNGYGINRWEDIASRVLPALEKFAVLKRKPNLNPPLPTKDLNQIKSLGQLEDITEKYQEKELASKTQKAGAEEQAFYDSKQATLLYNDATVKVVVPHTEAASCYFGVNTRWCTVAKNDNQFNKYNKISPLYIVLIKPINQRFQFHWGKPEFTDEQNAEINPNELADKYPVLWKIFTPIATKYKSLTLNQNPSPEVQMAAVQQNGWAIRFINNPPPKVQMAAVQQYGEAIHYIKNPSPEVQMAAVQSAGKAIQDIKNPSHEVQMAAVQQNGEAIQYIKNPSPEVQMAAVQQYVWVIDHIKNPSPEVQMAAVQSAGRVIQYIKNPSPEVQMAAVKQNGRAIRYINNPSPKVQMAAIQQDVEVIRHIKNPSPEVQMAAVQQDGEAIRYINNPPPKVQMAAVQQNGEAIRYINNPSHEVQMAAVQQDGTAIYHIKNPSHEVQMAAVQQDGTAIYHINNPNPELQFKLQMAAVQQDGRAIQYIKNPSPEVIALARSQGYDKKGNKIA